MPVVWDVHHSVSHCQWGLSAEASDHFSTAGHRETTHMSKNWTLHGTEIILSTIYIINHGLFCEIEEIKCYKINWVNMCTLPSLLQSSEFSLSLPPHYLPLLSLYVQFLPWGYMYSIEVSVSFRRLVASEFQSPSPNTHAHTHTHTHTIFSTIYSIKRSLFLCPKHPPTPPPPPPTKKWQCFPSPQTKYETLLVVCSLNMLR